MGRRPTISNEDILQIAREAWLEDPRTSTARIAERIGLSEAAIFKRFRTKVQFMLKAFGVQRGPPWVDLVEKGPDDRPLEDQLLEIARVIEAFFRKLIPRIVVLKGVGLSPEDIFGDDDDPPPLVGFRALKGWFERAQASGLIGPHLDPAALTVAFIGPFQGRAFWRHMFHDRIPIDDERYLRDVVSLFCDGMRPPEVTP